MFSLNYQEVAPPSLLSIQQGLYSTFKHPSKQQPVSPIPKRSPTSKRDGTDKKAIKSPKTPSKQTAKASKPLTKNLSREKSGSKTKKKNLDGEKNNEPKNNIAIIVDSPSKHQTSIEPEAQKTQTTKLVTVADVTSNKDTTQNIDYRNNENKSDNQETPEASTANKTEQADQPSETEQKPPQTVQLTSEASPLNQLKKPTFPPTAGESSAKSILFPANSPLRAKCAYIFT